MGSGWSRPRWLTRLERLCLHLDRDLGVPMGCVQADVSKPGTNDVDLDSGLQEVNRGGVAPRVGSDGLAV